MSLTASFVGPASEWHNAQLRLHDVQGLWGGREIYVSLGRILIRQVSRGRHERRVEFVDDEAARAFFQLCIENDFLTIEIEMRDGLPDEPRPTLVLINAAVGQHTVAKWGGQKAERFDRIYTALLVLEKRAESMRPVYKGPFDSHWTFDKVAPNK